MISLALYQPDQAGNVGTLLRMGACVNIGVHIIHPCGFSFCEKAFRRSAMDYSDHALIYEYDDYHDFISKNSQSRIILLTTKASCTYTDFSFQENDILLLGQESAGVPKNIHQNADERIKIPMIKTMRSMNIAIAGAFIIGEALRQTNGFNYAKNI
jgi:tRNA (cytidine/uridine-2'-O-)-methyltransferase